MPGPSFNKQRPSSLTASVNKMRIVHPSSAALCIQEGQGQVPEALNPLAMRALLAGQEPAANSSASSADAAAGGRNAGWGPSPEQPDQGELRAQDEGGPQRRLMRAAAVPAKVKPTPKPAQKVSLATRPPNQRR